MLTLPLSYDRPPLTMNRPVRNHRARSRINHEIHEEIRQRVRALSARQRAALPITVPVQIELVWSVPNQRVRDATGPTPTLKACEDGLVRAGVLVDDRHQMVPRSSCRIEVTGSYGMRLEISRFIPPWPTDPARPLTPSSILDV